MVESWGIDGKVGLDEWVGDMSWEGLGVPDEKIAAEGDGEGLAQEIGDDGGCWEQQRVRRLQVRWAGAVGAAAGTGALSARLPRAGRGRDLVGGVGAHRSVLPPRDSRSGWRNMASEAG